jgi:hypothetical protein
MTPHDAVISGLQTALDILNEKKPVLHPVHNVTAQSLNEWLQAVGEVQNITKILIMLVYSDLPRDTQNLIDRIRLRESELIWQEDKAPAINEDIFRIQQEEEADESGNNGPFPSCYP